MQKNPITYPTGGQAVANDGLLAGRELESDAELIALGWLKPTDLFEGDELPAIYPEDDAQERADLLSARLAEREAKRKAERDAWLAIFPEDRTAFELATDFGADRRPGSHRDSTRCRVYGRGTNKPLPSTRHRRRRRHLRRHPEAGPVCLPVYRTG